MSWLLPAAVDAMSSRWQKSRLSNYPVVDKQRRLPSRYGTQTHRSTEVHTRSGGRRYACHIQEHHMDITDSWAYQMVSEKLYSTAREKFLPTRVYDKAKGYIDTVEALIDRDTRAATMFTVGVSTLTSIGSKVLGASLEDHPYFALHKAHIQALAAALNAQSQYQNALAALDSAAKAADASDVIAGQTRQLINRMMELRFQYGLAGGFAVDTVDLTTPVMPPGMQLLGQLAVVTRLGTATAASYAAFLGWQAAVCGVYARGLMLLTMIRVEWQVATRGGQLFRDKLEKLASSSSQISNVAGKAAEQEMYWQQYDRAVAPQRSGGRDTSAAIADPGRYVAGNVSDVEAVVRKLAAICDIAMARLTPEDRANRMARAL